MHRLGTIRGLLTNSNLNAPPDQRTNLRSFLWSENIVEINKQISDIASQERLLAQLKQQGVVDPDIFISRGNQLAEQRREAKLEKSRILRTDDDQMIQRTQALLDILEEGLDLLMAFDGALFSELVEKITIQNNSTAIFRLINGLELPEHFERRKLRHGIQTKNALRLPHGVWGHHPLPQRGGNGTVHLCNVPHRRILPASCSGTQ